MIDALTAKPLTNKQIDQAYPLVRAVAPELSVERWRDFATGVCVDGAEGTRGIMTVQNDRGYILGLFSHGVCDHLRLGRVLAVDNLMVVDLFDTAGAMEALLEAMERLAVERECVAIHTDLPEHLSTLPESCRAAFDWFRASARACESQRLVRLLGEPPCRPLDRAAAD